MINKELLRPGDLLFYKPKNFKSGIAAWFITWAQNVIGKSPIEGKGYCHVALIDKDTDYLLESRWPKSRRWEINWIKLDKHYKIELWRVKETSTENIEKVMDWGYSHLGEWYDLGLFVWGLFDQKHKEICSTYVGKAWKNAGIYFKLNKKINRNAEFTTPDELVNNTEILKRIA